MQNKRVLIIGAGASNALHPQFALGSGLLQQISDRVTDRTSSQPYLSNLLNKMGFDRSICSQFVHHLDEYKNTSEYPSIDGFLDEVSSYPEFHSVKADFLQIGKFSIMFHILGYEGEIKNPQTGGLKKDAWIHELSKFIDEKNILDPTNIKDDLKIISFNYDRNIEHFLYNDERFKKKKSELKTYIENSLIHMYGKIGDLEWQNQDDFFEFGEYNSNAEKIFNRKNAIDIMYAERMGGSFGRESKAKKWMQDITTNYVGAFGFNFDLINYRLLALQNLGNDNPRMKFIANVFPNNDENFINRRKMAKTIRNVKHDAKIEYLSCTDFVKNFLL